MCSYVSIKFLSSIFQLSFIGYQIHIRFEPNLSVISVGRVVFEMCLYDWDCDQIQVMTGPNKIFLYKL